MFGFFGAGQDSNPAPQQPANPPAGQQPAPQNTQNTQNTQNPGQPPAGQQPAPGGQPAPQQPDPAQQPAPTQTPQQTINLAQLLLQEQQSGQPEQTPQQLAEAFISNMMQQPDPTPLGAVSINPQALRENFAGVDMTAGVDLNALLNDLNGDNGPQALQTALQSVQLNTMTAMVPVINQLVQAAFERATAHAQQETHHNLTASAIVTAFHDRHGYGQSPVVSQMLSQFANVLAQSAPRGTSPAALAERLHVVFQGLGASMYQTEQQQQTQQRPGLQTDHSGLFG